MDAHENTLPWLQAIAAERERQREKWGEQDNPDEAYSELGTWITLGEADRLSLNHGGKVSWSRILSEELGEAAQALRCAHDPDHLEHAKQELVQCAAVIVAWLENLTRRNQ